MCSSDLINAGIPSIMGSHWMRMHLPVSKNQELSYTGRLMDASECRDLGLLNVVAPPGEVRSAAVALAREVAAKPSVALKRTKMRFRELALPAFEDAFRAGVLGQQEAFAAGEPQAIMARFMAERAARKR